MLLLLIAPTIYFLPKFFEIRTSYKLYRIPKTFNCTQLINSQVPPPTMSENYTHLLLDNTLPNIIQEENPIDVVCNKSLYLIQSLSDNEVPLLTENNKSDSFCGPRVENIIDHDSLISEDNVTLNMSYNISTQIATVCRRHLIPILDRTDLRKNPLYYKIYILGLTTLFAQIIPMGILIYLNIKICLALRTTTGDYLNIAIRNQRKNNVNGRQEKSSK